MGVTFVILGATGDLTKKKLIPAVYRLVKNKKIGKFAIVGVARKKVSTKKLLRSARKHVENVDKRAWGRVERSTHYFQLDFYDKEGYAKLGSFLDVVERKHTLSGNRIFYLSTAPQHFDEITSNLAKSGIAKQSKKWWTRLVYEKPFGRDLKSARRINKCIARVFTEKQVYRIDHFLGKELVENIALVRFTNRVLEPLWNRNHIENVQIILNENFGIESRGGYYDKYGAVKDMVQNHILQLLALTAIEAPRSLTGEYIRNEKVNVLKKVRIKDMLLGQYQGYRSEEKVKKSSKTETFVAARAEVNNQRWRGIPFYLKTGKFLASTESMIVIKFKEVQCLLAKSCPTDTNYLTIRIKKDEGFSLELNAKVPGMFAVVPVKMDFCHSCIFGVNTPEAYETLLYDVIENDQSVFVRNDEIEQAWRIIDTALRRKRKVYPYRKKSAGPKELEEWSRKHNMRWKA